MPASSSLLRQPRLRCLIGGTPLAAAVAADITSNNHYAADRFRLTAISPRPK